MTITRESAASREVEVEVLTLPARPVVGLRERISVPELAGFFDRAVATVLEELFRQGFEPAGPPIVIYRHEESHEFDVTIGFWVEEPHLFADVLVVDQLPAGRVVRALHVGPYETLADTYTVLSRWFGDRQVTTPTMMWEEYLVGPDAVSDPAAYRTRVVYPLHRRPITD